MTYFKNIFIAYQTFGHSKIIYMHTTVHRCTKAIIKGSGYYVYREPSRSNHLYGRR